MRLGPFEVRRLTAAAQPTPKPPRELGASGTINMSGFLTQSEYLNELRGLSGLQIYDQMLRSDGSVQEAIEHIYAPIKNANWQIEPASDDPEHLEHAALVTAAYFEHLSQPWLETLDAQLDYLAYGHAVFEMSWQVVEAELGYDDPLTGERVTLPSRQFVSFQDFAPRLQSTLYRWMMKDGQLVSVIQRVFVDAEKGYQEIELPAESLLIFTNRKRGDEFTGRSVLRAARKHWLMKEIAEKQEIVALERWGVQIPVIFPSQGSRTDDAMMDRYEDILANLRGGEFTYVLMPEPRANGTNDGCEIVLLSPSGTYPDFGGPIGRHRGDIKAAMLARFAELGHASVGARATGDIQSVVWFAALHAVASYVCNVHQQAIKRLIDLNYAGVSQYPKLTATDIEVRNFAEWAAGVSQLVSSGAVLADASFRAAVREAADFPDEDEGTEGVEAEPDPNDPNEPNEPVEPEVQPGDPKPQDTKQAPTAPKE
jgi:hypothetical protein